MYVDRARLLMQSSRYREAEQELARALVDNPDDGMVHALAAVNYSMLKDHPAAVRHGEQGVALSPESSFAHYALGIAYYNADRRADAERSIREALRLDPRDADLYALMGQIHLAQGEWEIALADAERGLAIDAEHVDNLNIRAKALGQLNRLEEAGAVIEQTLRLDPDNAEALVNLGWHEIERGMHKAALEHFREALRLEPQNERARRGVVEGLKARNPIYRIMLRYFLWMSKLSDKAAWGFVIGMFVLVRVLRGIARSNPELAPFIDVFFGLYLLFVFLTWTAQPLFNLTLRLHPIGRYALSREEIRTSNWTGGALLIAILAGLGWLLTGSTTLSILAIGSGLMVIPIAGTMGTSAPGPRRILMIYTGLLGAVLLIGLGIIATGGNADLPTMIFAIGLFAFSWIANAVRIKRS